MPTSCIDCCLRLGVFKKKRRCNKCRDVFCDGCFSKVQRVSRWSESEHRRLGECMKCFVLFSSVINRDDVRLLDVKHLKRFLALNQIKTDGCKEKFHLVDLVMQFAGRNGQLSLSEIEGERRRTEEVEALRIEAENRREEEERYRNSLHINRTSPDDASSETASRDDNNTTYRSHNNEHNKNEDRPSASKRLRSVEDITTLDDINQLSVLELKKILVVNFISYKGCFEKTELIDKVAQLWQERERMMSQSSLDENFTVSDDKSKSKDDRIYDKDLCKICMDNYIDCVLLDCGHLVTCAKCGRQLAECPVCRQLIVRVVHIFRA